MILYKFEQNIKQKHFTIAWIAQKMAIKISLYGPLQRDGISPAFWGILHCLTEGRSEFLKYRLHPKSRNSDPSGLGGPYGY